MVDQVAVDVLITNGDIFTADRRRPRIRPGAIAINGRRIVALGPESEIHASYKAARTIDAKGGMVHPGLIDTHLHGISLALHGIPIDLLGTEGTDLPTYAQLKVATDEEITAALTKAAIVSLLRRGFTCFMEAGTVYETDAFAESLMQCGMRGLVSVYSGWDQVDHYAELAPGMLNDVLLERAPVDAQSVLDRCARELARNADPDALVQGYVCLYGEGSASDQLMAEAYQLARREDVLFYMHQSYERHWVDDEIRRHGRTGPARLDEIGALTRFTTLSHMNVLTDDDYDLVVASKPGIVWCPNNTLRHQILPNDKVRHADLYKNGVSVSLGIDVALYHSLGTMGLVSLLLSAAVGNRLADSDPFYMQTIDAANNMVMGDKIGSLEVGKLADIVIRGIGDLCDVPLDDEGAILALDSAMIPVETVMIDGKIVMEHGRLTAMDQDRILLDALQQRDRLLANAVN